MMSMFKMILSSWPFNKGNQTRTKIDHLPDEMLLQILCYLSTEELLFVVSRVSKRWRTLSKDPKLWRSRSVFYDREKPFLLTKCLASVPVLGVLNLGGHESLHKSVIKAFSHSELNSVKELHFLSSCRTPPEKVISILRTLAPSLESLTICLNDELVSYGCDGKTCYDRSTHNRPGILFMLLAELENLKHLTLRGGYSTIWYHDEIHASQGCNLLESLDMRDFEEILSDETPTDDILFVEAIIRKNVNTLKCLKVPTISLRERNAILICQKNITEFGVSAAQMMEILDHMSNISILHINGRTATSGAIKHRIAEYICSSTVMQQLTELSLEQFDDAQNIILPAISSTCIKLKIFRSEKNVLFGEGITSLIRNLTSLEEIYLPHSYSVSEKHLSLMSSCLPKLAILDLTGNGFMDCMNSIRRLHNHTNENLKIIGTSDCLFSHTHGCLE